MNHPDSISMMCSHLLLAFAFLLRRWGLDRSGERCGEKSCMCHQIDGTPRESYYNHRDHQNQVDSIGIVAGFPVQLHTQD